MILLIALASKNAILIVEYACEKRAEGVEIVEAAVEMAPRLAEAWRSFGEPSADARALAAGLSCPVLVAWAKQDRVVQLRRSLPAIRRIPNVRIETFAGGHAPFRECPEEFSRTLESFLDEAVTTAACHGRPHGVRAAL